MWKKKPLTPAGVLYRKSGGVNATGSVQMHDEKNKGDRRGGFPG